MKQSLGDELMKTMIPLIHCIEKRALEEIKPYFQPEVFIELCKACTYYNKIWACPPYDFDIVKILDDYQYAYIIGSKIFINDLGDSFKELLDNKNLEYVSNEIYKAARAVLDDKIVAIGDMEKDSCVLFAGRCMICEHCTREKQLPCMHPEKIHFSLESLGFDVSSICEDILGDKIQWAKESLPEYFILVSAVFSKKELKIKDIYHTIL